MPQKNTLDDYGEIVFLGRYEHICLVLHKQSKRVYVKKCLEVYKKEVYEQLAKICDVHIPKLFLCQEQDGKLYTVEEYINGETLAERVEREHGLTEEDARPLLLQLCKALACLHDQPHPIIHRDIKLSNIMITGDGIVKLIDFNAARYHIEGAARDTELIGTAGYAAPEQFGFSQTDARTDIYALGIVIERMLTGSYGDTEPYTGPLSAIIRKCTYLDPDRRYQTIHEVAQDLLLGTGGAAPTAHTQARLWPIPGFRSHKVWKMAVAIFGYFTIFSLSAELEVETNAGRPFYTALDWLCCGIALFFIVAMVTDYGGISRYLPLIDRKDWWVRIGGYILFGTFVFVIAVCTPEMIKMLLE